MLAEFSGYQYKLYGGTASKGRMKRETDIGVVRKGGRAGKADRKRDSAFY